MEVKQAVSNFYQSTAFNNGSKGFSGDQQKT